MRNAFSLVELSIVLVILGLLTGGILTGQSLIRAAELRSVTTEFQQYQTAVMTFRDQYFAMPGDMKNATDFWGSAGGTNGNDTVCRNALNKDRTTCNGNGDGSVGLLSGALQREFLLFWDHLSAAGLIPGTYTGTSAQDSDSGCTSTVEMLSGCNVPSAKVDSSAYWHTFTQSSVDASTSGFGGFYYGSYGNFFELGKGSWHTNPKLNIFSNEEMWGIDKKIDDGKPGLGKVRTYHTCIHWSLASTYDAPEAAVYDLQDPDKDCGLILLY